MPNSVGSATPTIPESIIERSYEKQIDNEGNAMKQKDVNRSPNVTDKLEEFVLAHNEPLPEDSTRRLLWFSDSLTNKQRQKRAKNVIRDKLTKHLQSDWLDGSITFNKCQLDHGKELEACIEEVASTPLMVVYAQSERNWAIRRLMEDIFSSRRKTYLRKARKTDIVPAQNLGTCEVEMTTALDKTLADSRNIEASETQNEEVDETTVPDFAPVAPKGAEIPLTENEAVVASSRAYNGLNDPSERSLQETENCLGDNDKEKTDEIGKDSCATENVCEIDGGNDKGKPDAIGKDSATENICEIDSQISALQDRKRLLESRLRTAASRSDKDHGRSAPHSRAGRKTSRTLGPKRSNTKKPRLTRRKK